MLAECQALTDQDQGSGGGGKQGRIPFHSQTSAALGLWCWDRLPEHPQSSATTQKDTAGESEGSPVAFSFLPLPGVGVSWDFGLLGPLLWVRESPFSVNLLFQ